MSANLIITEGRLVAAGSEATGASADLTALTRMSTGHFFRTFKATFGEAPFAYIARRRLERPRK